MSAYHHFGMVSPFRVARDASRGGNTGAKKFADEFLTWRELAYCFCYHNSDILESLQVIATILESSLIVNDLCLLLELLQVVMAFIMSLYHAYLVESLQDMYSLSTYSLQHVL